MFDPSADQADIATLLQQVAALRKQQYTAPQGQMVSGIYVKPAMSQQLQPLLGGVVADVQESRAKQKQQDLDQRAQADLVSWLRRRPQAQTVYGAGEVGPTMTQQQPTDASIADWASSGLKNPLTKGIANAALTDNIIQAPIRAEKQADKLEIQRNVDQRYQEDRAARIQLSRENAQNRMDMLQQRLDAAAASGAETNGIRLQIAEQNRQMRQLAIEAGDRRAAAALEAKEAAANAKAGAGKAFSATEKKELSKIKSEYEGHDRLYNSFDPKAMYTANPDDPASIAKAVGAAEVGGNALARIAMDPKAREKALRTNQWWAQFRMGDNVVRNGLFGSALTATENAAWLKTTVTPQDDEQKIKEAIEIRRKITRDKYNEYLRLAKGEIPQEIGATPAVGGSPMLKNSPSFNSPDRFVKAPAQASRDTDAAGVRARELSDARQELALAKKNRAPADAIRDLQVLVDGLERDVRAVGGTPAAAAPEAGGWSIREKQ